MSISDQINRIKTNIANAYTSLESKGATIPADKNSNNLATTVDSISSSAFPNKAFDVDSFGVATAPKGHFKSSDFSSLTKISDYAMYYKWALVDASEYTDNVINFGNVTEIGSNGLSYAFYDSKIGTTSNPCVLNFDNLTTVGEKGLYYAFTGIGTSDGGVLLSNNSFKKITSIGEHGMYCCFFKREFLNNILSFDSLTSVKRNALTWFFGTGRTPNLETITFPELTEISSIDAFSSFCTESSVKSVLFEKLTSVNANGAFISAFNGCSLLNDIQFPKLETIQGYNAFNNAFQNCTSLTTISFPSLTSVTGESMGACFKGCTSLTTVSFPSLVGVGYYSFNAIFYGCTSLTTVSFPSLTSLTGEYAFNKAFQKCTSLTTISFPSLTTFATTNGLYNCFVGCTALTEIHFRADAQSVIEGLAQYSTKFGAANATIYFDL